ncbi:hypothetical protein TNCV_2687741 [Trichonephila clavipes]|nr:hypothetical protein TNCV_2687741 [Trichonephila clavipes]
MDDIRSSQAAEDFVFEKAQWAPFRHESHRASPWDALGRRVAGRQPSPQISEELRSVLKKDRERQKFIDSICVKCSKYYAVKQYRILQLRAKDKAGEFSMLLLITLLERLPRERTRGVINMFIDTEYR